MRRRRPLELDELMIVNPSSSGLDAVLLGADSALYRVMRRDREDDEPRLGSFFLGQDGVLYQLQDATGEASAASGASVADGVEEGDASALPRFFLGEDGTVYEAIRSPATD